MKNRIFTSYMAGLAITLTSLVSLAGESVNRTIEASPKGRVEIEHVQGNVTVKGWDRDEVQVKGELGEDYEEFIFERDGNEVLIKVKSKKRGWGGWSNDNSDELDIYVPIQSRVSYTSVNGSVDIEEIENDVTVDTVNGSVVVADVKGRVNLEAVNGNITSKNITGRLMIETVNGNVKDKQSIVDSGQFNTVNGNIRVESNVQDISAETVNGNMRFELKQVSDFETETVNGGVYASMELTDDADVDASSVGGSIELNLQEDVSAKFDIQGHAGGKIVNRLSVHKMQKAKYGPSRWLKFSLNGGGANVDISTVNGRVTLDKK